MSKYKIAPIHAMAVALVASVALLLLPVAVLATGDQTGIGTSPAYIRSENLLAGSHYEQEIVISRSNATNASTAVLELDAPDINDWFSFDPGESIPLPAGEQRVTFTVNIDVPNNAQLGDYSGYLRVKLEEENNAGQIAVVPAVRLDINLTVTNQEERSVKVTLADIMDYPTNQPLVLTLKVVNEGNVAAGPTKATIVVSDLNENELSTLESTTIPTVQSFSTDEVEVSYSEHSLMEGDYFGLVTVYDGSTELYKDTIAFSVTEAVATTGGPTAEGENQTLGYVLLIGGGVFLVIVLAVGFWYLFGAGKKEKEEKKPKPEVK
jgi:hypothetical protein